MPSKVYCIASAKGGSGKTMITANFAAFLASVGKKCLIIDCDAATHGMTLLYLAEVSSSAAGNKFGLFEFGKQSENTSEQEELRQLQENIVTLNNGVDLFPGTYRFTADFQPEKAAGLNNLENLTKELREEYDVIFLDAQAGADAYSRLAMSREISDEVIIVSEYDPMSAAGVERLKQLAGQDLDFSRTSILLNKMLPEFVEKFSEFLSVANYLPPIPWNADVVRAYAKRQLALDVEHGNAFTLAVMRTVSALTEDNKEIDIETWAKERAYTLRAPLQAQYEAAEAELSVALNEKNLLERKRRLRALLQGYAILTVCATALVSLLSTSVADAWLRFGLGIEWGIVFIALVTIPVSYWATSQLFRREKTAESSRLDRIIAALEEKLRSLEVLRSADYETIVRRGESFREEI